MRGDYSRERFAPERHYSSVLQQQGRVALDAEWNEYTAIQDRRWRAETIDVIGRCGVPEGFENSFAITEAGGNLFVGAGRIYVDGLLAENHGAAPTEFSPALEESYGTGPVDLDEQPYVPTPFPAIQPGRHMMYVDVWTREVAHRQVEGLIEPALGVDTTTREQTVWQVRLLEDIGDDVTCRTPFTEIANWPAGNLPSGARLTTATVEVDIQEDPCVIPPSGGYRGLENQLYRVEVHDLPAAGTFRVKWSRDNATVSASVMEVLPGAEVVRIDEIGKDDVLRFKNGDWVEFINNDRELAGEPGEMRQVQVSDGELTLEFNGALPADLVADPEERHLRVVRWDQADNLDADGLIALNDGDSVVLEAGIEITIDLLAGTSAHIGDYWCFAARAVGTSVEILDREPPLGIHHHFCKLAILEVDAGGGIDINDCRPEFPPLTEISAGCCTVVVEPGEDIQSAIDSLPPAGGCVCLKTGDHVVQQRLRIRNSSVTLHGESPGTRVIRSNGLTILEIRSEDFRTLTDVNVSAVHFDVRAVDDTFEAAIEIRDLEYGGVHDCRITEPFRSLNTGIRLSSCESVKVRDCRIENAFTGIWVATDSTDLLVRGNTIHRESQRNDDGLVGIWLMDAYGASRVECNRVSGYLTGISLNAERANSQDPPRSSARSSKVRFNDVRLFGVNIFGTENRYYAIDVAAPECLVSNNRIVVSANWHTSIRASSSRISITDNTLWSNFFADDGDPPGQLPIAIQYAAPVEARWLLNDGVVANNRFIGDQHGVIASGLDGLSVADNTMEPPEGSTSLGIGMSNASNVVVCANSISDAFMGVVAFSNDGLSIKNDVNDNRIVRCNYGISVSAQTSLRLANNIIEESPEMGIMAVTLTSFADISGNTVRNSGYREDTAYGVLVLFHNGELQFVRNEVLDTGSSPDGEQVSDLTIGFRADFIRECVVENNHIGYENGLTPDLEGEHRAVLLRGLQETSIVLGDRRLIFGFPLMMSGNRFNGPGRNALVELRELRVTDNVVRRFERVAVSDNYFNHSLAAIANDTTATLQLRGHRAICQGNHFKSQLPVPPVNFNRVRSTYLGNVAMAPPINFLGVPAVLADFNLQ